MNVGELLATVPYRALRGMATRLQLRQDRQHQKRDWITAIATGWQRAPTRQQWLARLSSAAHSALTRLLAAEQIPAALFWAEYGAVRQVTAQQQWTPPPWQAPATVSEELYYSGLLCPTPHPLARAQVVSLPADLRPFLAGGGQEAGQTGRQEAEKTRSGEDKKTRRQEAEKLESSSAVSPGLPLSRSPGLLPAGWALCHDVGQLLIYLQSQPVLRLQHGRWLSRAQLAVLNERLWAPVAAAPLTSHRRTPYLRLLSFLADVSAFQRQGQITAHGWQWLAAPPAAQVAALQHGWLNATPDDRQRYALPDGAMGSSVSAVPGPTQLSF